jgi:hypothetical protein
LARVASSVWSGGGPGQWQGIGGKFAKSGAGMITFGTIAGGAGAALTGGNFWQGAVTGLVVSGLNHYAHRAGYIKDLRSRFKKDANSKYILNPDGKPDFSQAGVETINGAVEGLQEAYRVGGKPKVRFDLVSKTLVGLTDFDGINLNLSKITTNLKFAAALFHEYRHAWQYSSGNYFYWQKEYTYSSTEWYMERDAYWFQIQMGAGSFFDGYSNYAFYRSLTQKNIKYK